MLIDSDQSAVHKQWPPSSKSSESGIELLEVQFFAEFPPKHGNDLQKLVYSGGFRL